MHVNKYKLICFDMDGVIFRDTNFWLELHRRFGTEKEGTALTKKYLHSDYDKLVQEVVKRLWKGRDAKPYFDLVNSLEYLPGVQAVFNGIRKKGYKTAIISASGIDAAKRAQKDLGIDYIYANELVIQDGKVNGEFRWPVGAGMGKKADILKSLCTELGIPLKQAVFVGDSATDIEACKIAGISIAFNPTSEELQAIASHTVISSTLTDILQFIP